MAEERLVETHCPELGEERNKALKNAEEMERGNLKIRAGRLKVGRELDPSTGARPKDSKKVAMETDTAERVADRRASRRLQWKEAEFAGI